MTNSQSSTTKSILYAISFLLTITVALFVGVVTAEDSIVPGTIASLCLMVLAFAGGYAIGRFIVRIQNRRRSSSKNSNLLPEGMGFLVLGLSMCGLASSAAFY